MKYFDLKTQYKRLSDPVNERIQAVLNHGQFVLGPEVLELERALANRVCVEHCIAVSSGTDALLMVLMALGVKAGDEVITSPFTFFSTAEMIALLGAKPVFVDIDRQTYNINPELLESAITSRTKLILPVSLFGQCADYDTISEIAQRYHLPVLEDGAQSFGAFYKDRPSCSLTDIAATSFFPSKPLGCYGDGGALFTNNDELEQLLREIRSHGETARNHHVRLGINGRLDSLQAAILLAKLEIFDDEVVARGKAAKRYSELIREAFKKVDPDFRVTPPFVESHNISVYGQYTIEVASRESVRAAMEAHEIPTATHYAQPLHLQPVFSYLGKHQGAYPAAESAATRVMSLPMHPYITEKQQVQVVGALKDAVFST